MDTEAISLAKINKPRLQKVLPRPRLFRLLDKSLSHPASWISGPGGSGKTTLVAHYIEEYKLPCLWYQIDAGDSDISTFFYYLGLAGKRTTPGKKDLPLLTPEYILGIPTFTKRFFEELLGRLKKPGILVLDNYQEVHPDSLLHEVISDALRVIPDNIHVFILSRTSPPSVLARARANNILQEIDWPTLRLNNDETKALFDFFNEKPPSEAFAENLQKKTDGWIAGIILLLKKAESRDINLQPFTEFSAREIFEYFKNEIFNKADPETREFLLITSIFPRMSVDMAKELSGSAKTSEILNRIQRNHWFIEQYSSRQAEYQYHPMFREFLLNLAEKTYSDNEFRQLKKQAAGLLEKDGRLEAAIELYFKSGHLSEAFRLINSEAELLTLQGRFQTLLEWLERFPDDFVYSHPQIHYWMGVCRLSTDPKQGRPFFEKALSAFQNQRNTEKKCLSLCGILDSISYGFDSFRDIDKWIPYIELYSLEFADLPSEKLKGLMTASTLLALSLRQPDHPDFSTWEGRGMKILQKSTSEDIKSRIITAFLVHRLFTGKLAEAEHFIFFYRELAQSLGVTSLMQITLKDMEAYYYWLCGDFEKSREMVAEALKMANEIGVYVLNPLLIGHDIAAALNMADTREAEILLGRLKDYIEHTSLWTRELFHLLNIWYALQVKDLRKASLNAEFLAEYVEYTGTPLSSPASYLGQAYAKQAAGRFKEAKNSLDKALAICHRVGSPQMEFGCHLARAEFALDAEDETAAGESLQKAMAIGRAHQYVTTWLWRPDAMTRLCLKALEENIEVDYVQHLIRSRGLMPERP
ncbi:MAG TPA: hypothetical protein VKN73_04540, partial [Desulfosalsimonadaceae bacterium]|nr:hypothetical protein [Desulfosalsimonadaceae bacterium]